MLKQKEKYLITKQFGFFQDIYLANAKQKLSELYNKNPNIAESEKRVILEYWKAYDGLTDVLGDKLLQFTAWFFKATSNETITRCLRALKEAGTIPLTPEKIMQRQEKEQQHKDFWINERSINGR
jgi:hypothetical protein